MKKRRHLIAADGHIYLDIGVERLEFLQKLGQRGARNARKAAEAELVALGAALRGGLLAQRVASVDNALYIRKKQLSLLRKADTVTAAIEQGAAQLCFQIIHKMRHCRLRVAQLRRGLAEAAAIDRCQHCAQSSVIHNAHTFLISIIIAMQI